MNTKKYTDVAKLAGELAGDLKVESSIRERVAKTRLMDCLVTERCKKNVSQSEVAKKLGVSVSKISRLEDDYDDAIRLGELKSYVSALDLKLSLLITDDKLPIADQIKHCVFRIEEMLTHLTHLAKKCDDDKEIVDAIYRFRGEVLFNFLTKFKATGENFPVFQSDPEPCVTQTAISRVSPSKKCVKA